VSSQDDLEAMVAIARRAGERVRELWERHLAGGVEVEMKGPNDPVTEADKAANTIICEALAERFPDASVVAEESAPRSREELAAMLVRPRVFYVDPLDGTREFVDRVSEFAVMIGLAEDGRARAGVVLRPVEGELYAGLVGGGAFVEDGGARRTPLAVSARKTFVDARMVVSRSHLPPLVDPLRRRLGVPVMEPLGSVGVKVSRIALGRADLYVHDGPGMKLWDTCGPEAVLTAAGGRMSDLEGAPIEYGAHDLRVRRGVVATNGVLHAGVLSAVGWAEREVQRLRRRGRC
jgi:3'(2'), 5'-bisphosphate nucleotidase